MNRKIICLILSLLMLAALVGCGGTNNTNVIGSADGPPQVVVSDPGLETGDAPEEDAPSAQAAGEAPYAFIYKGVSLTADADVAPLVEALGEPLSYFEAASCAFEGLDKIYTYGGFEIDTYPTEDGDFISAVILKDDSVTTAEGLMIGESVERITEVYGEPTEASDSLYVYVKGGAALRFILRSGEIASIEYMSLITSDAQ